MPLNLESPDWGLVLPHLIGLITTVVVSLLDAFLPKAQQYTVITAASLIGRAFARLQPFGLRQAS